MPDQPELRRLLTDALNEHMYEWRDNGWHCRKCDLPPGSDEDDWSSEHVIRALLALPGIAIVALPQGQPWGEGQTDFGTARIDERCPGDVCHFTPGTTLPGRWISAGRARAFAASLLAAAGVAEEQTNA